MNTVVVRFSLYMNCTNFLDNPIFKQTRYILFCFCCYCYTVFIQYLLDIQFSKSFRSIKLIFFTFSHFFDRMLKFNFKNKLIEQVPLKDLIQIGMKNYVFRSSIYIYIFIYFLKLKIQIEQKHYHKVVTIDMNKSLVHLHIDKMSISIPVLYSNHIVERNVQLIVFVND